MHLWKFPLAQVQRLQQQLQEEKELHAIFEKAIEKNAIKFSIAASIPHYVCLSVSLKLEMKISKLNLFAK